MRPIQDRLDRIHDLMCKGYTDKRIRDELGISERNWFGTYKPKLNEKYRKIWLDKQMDELYHASQITQDQLQDALNNAYNRAREPKSNPGWGSLEAELAITLFDFKHSGISAINSHRLKQIQQKVQGDRVLPESTDHTESAEEGGGNGKAEGTGTDEQGS